MNLNHDVTYVNYSKKHLESECQSGDAIATLEKLIYLIEEPMADDCVHRHLLLLEDFFATYTTDFVSFFSELCFFFSSI